MQQKNQHGAKSSPSATSFVQKLDRGKVFLNAERAVKTNKYGDQVLNPERQKSLHGLINKSFSEQGWKFMGRGASRKNTVVKNLAQMNAILQQQCSASNVRSGGIGTGATGLFGNDVSVPTMVSASGDLWAGATHEVQAERLRQIPPAVVEQTRKGRVTEAWMDQHHVEADGKERDPLTSISQQRLFEYTHPGIARNINNFQMRKLQHETAKKEFEVSVAEWKEINKPYQAHLTLAKTTRARVKANGTFCGCESPALSSAALHQGHKDKKVVHCTQPQCAYGGEWHVVPTPAVADALLCKCVPQSVIDEWPAGTPYKCPHCSARPPQPPLKPKKPQPPKREDVAPPVDPNAPVDLEVLRAENLAIEMAVRELLTEQFHLPANFDWTLPEVNNSAQSPVAANNAERDGGIVAATAAMVSMSLSPDREVSVVAGVGQVGGAEAT